jgi:hypothetical protein
MKKKLLLLACIIWTLNDINAQEDRNLRFAFAVQPSVSWIKPDIASLEREGNRIGFAYGVLSDIRLGSSPNYWFSTGIMVNSQGGTLLNSKYHDEKTMVVVDEAGNTALYPTFAIATEKYKLQYIDIPLTLKLKTNEIGYMTYYGQFGMDLGFNIKARKDVEYHFSDNIDRTIDDENISDETRLFRAALQIGLGGEYNISGSTSILAGIVWNNGLNSVIGSNYFAEDDTGKPIVSSDNKLEEGAKIKAISNYIGLTLGVFF